MEIKTTTNSNGQFICLSDIFKLYRIRYDREYNISQAIKNIPEKYIIKGRGRNSKTYIDYKILPFFLNTRRNIPNEFKKEILSYIENIEDVLPNNFEAFFCDICSDFLTGMFPNIRIKKQHTINNKTFDLLINDVVLIEFDEAHHKYTKVDDTSKNKIASQNNYKIIRINANTNYGIALSNVYKKIKLYLY